MATSGEGSQNGHVNKDVVFCIRSEKACMNFQLQQLVTNFWKKKVNRLKMYEILIYEWCGGRGGSGLTKWFLEGVGQMTTFDHDGGGGQIF